MKPMSIIEDVIFTIPKTSRLLFPRVCCCDLQTPRPDIFKKGSGMCLGDRRDAMPPVRVGHNLLCGSIRGITFMKDVAKLLSLRSILRWAFWNHHGFRLRLFQAAPKLGCYQPRSKVGAALSHNFL